MTEQQLVEQLKRAFAIAKKDLRIYYKRAPVLIFGLIMPFFLFLAFFMGRNMPVENLFTALLGMTIYFSSMSIGPAIVPFEARSRTLERLVSAPVSVWALFIGDVTASFLYGLSISTVPLIIGSVYGVNVIHWPVLGLGMIFSAICFASFGVLLSAYPPTDIPATVMMVSNLVKFPLVFVSGIFIPLWEMHSLARIVASFSPLTYFTDLVNYCTHGVSYYSVFVDFAALVGFALLFLTVAIKIHEKTLPQRL